MSHFEGVNRKSLLSKFRSNPLLHVQKIQGVDTTEEFQHNIMDTVSKYERTVVAACHAVGKTWTASKIILWFTSTFEGAKVITTAPTYKQVRMLLWSEIRTGFNNSKFPLGGQMGVTEWKLSDDWFAIGYTSKPEAGGSSDGQGSASSFQGFHGDHILVVFDEATGINSNIWVQMEGLMTSASVKFLGIGNPTTKSCEFYKCFSDPAYQKIHITCFESPNFPANGFYDKADLLKELNRLKEMNQDDQTEALTQYKVVNNHLITVRWVMRMILRWGIDHPLTISKCFAEFPDQDDKGLISLGLVEKAQFRSYTPKPHEKVAIGVDVARFGTDKTIITQIHGNQVTELKVLIQRDTSEITGEIIKLVKSHGSSTSDIHVAVDATGIGSGVVDQLKQAIQQSILPSYVEIRECHFGASPGGMSGSLKEKELKAKYVNLKARIYVELLEDLKKDLCLPDEDVYLEELPTIHYKFDNQGRWQIESKDEYKKRTGRTSPDYADSLALANYARYDGSGSGNFTEDLIQTQNNTIIQYSKGIDLW